jgi:hypothetical protein
MATSTNQITAPRVDLIDERTGKITREWYMFLYNLYTITGAGTGITAVINGGTGLGTIPSNGQLLIGNGTGYTLNTLGFGAGISVTNGSGTITVANTGVLSNIAGAGISVSGTTGNVTITNTGVRSWSGGTTGLTPAAATTGAVTLAGTLVVANGGTNGSATPTAGAVAYGSGTAYAFTAAGTTNQALLSAGAGTPTWNTLTSGSSILYGNGSGLFSNVTIGSGVSFVGGTLSATGTGGTVTSVSVVSANGFAGTVATATTTPAITLTTTITGLLKGNGTAISAATSGTDYAPATSGTSILYGNGSGGFSNVTVGSGLSFSAGTLSASSGTAPATKTADFTVGATETWLINNKSGSTCTVTLPAASSYTGRELTFKNMQAQSLVSASSNVVPIDSTTAGTAILLNVVGNWATMVSDGTNWVIMQAASNNNLLLE